MPFLWGRRSGRESVLRELWAEIECRRANDRDCRLRVWSGCDRDGRGWLLPAMRPARAAPGE